MSLRLKILHLSDLHIEKESLKDQRIVLKALFKDIVNTVQKNGAFDLVLFSGDLIAKGNYSDFNKDAAINEFIVPIIEATQIDPSRLILVPGNHDINLKTQSVMVSNAQKALNNDDAISKYLNEATQSSVATGLEEYNSILGRLDSSSIRINNSHYRTYQFLISGMKIGVAALNSAWHATGAPSDGDYGKLLIGRKQLDEAVESLKDADLKIAVTHHPLSWLSPKDSQNTHRQLLVNFDALFHGHNHEPDAQFTTGTSSSYFVSNAGCLYQHRDYFNGYCNIDYSPSTRKWTIQAREYYEARQEFDIAVRFSAGGVAEFTQSLESNSSTVPTLPSDEYIDASISAFNSRLLPSLVSDIAPRNLKAIFVDPLLSRVSQRRLNAGSKNGESGLFVPLKEILQLRRNVVFIGGKDMGKTTLLQRVCAQSMEFTGDLPPFGAYIDLDAAGETPASLIDSIISFGSGAYRKSEIVSLLKNGLFVICFDNLQEQRIKQLKAVREFCSQYEGCRFLFSMTENVDYSISSNSVPLIGEGLEVFYIHPFGRKETRLLTQNWFGENSDECSSKVDDILSLLGRLNIPRSPFLISALLWIREKQTQFSPINQAEILDALIDGVMEKLSENKDRSRIDSTIKRHYLAALAEHLHNLETKRIASQDLEKFTLHYFTSKGLPAPAGPFLTELKSKGILLEIGDEVTFMFDAIRAFFLSTRLHESPDLLAKALSSSHFLELGEELDYYTGRHRDQHEVLSKSVEIVRDFFEDTALAQDLKTFDKLRISESPISKENASKLKLAAKQRPTADQRHAILDSVDEQTRRQLSVVDEKKSQRTKTATGRYFEALRIGSSILRNSELVGDVALKEAAYAQFSVGWCQILIEVMTVLEREGEKEFALGDVKEDPILGLLEGLLPTDNPSMAKYLTKLIMPNVIISFALESIGTSKLQLIMEKHEKLNNPTVQRLLDVFLMVDLRLPRWLNHLESFLKDNHKNRFISELVFSKLFQIFMLGRLRHSEEERVKTMLGDSISLLTSEKRSKVKTRMKGNFLRNLEKRRLVKRK